MPVFDLYAMPGHAQHITPEHVSGLSSNSLLGEELPRPSWAELFTPSLRPNIAYLSIALLKFYYNV